MPKDRGVIGLGIFMDAVGEWEGGAGGIVGDDESEEGDIEMEVESVGTEEPSEIYAGSGVSVDDETRADIEMEYENSRGQEFEDFYDDGNPANFQEEDSSDEDSSSESDDETEGEGSAVMAEPSPQSATQDNQEVAQNGLTIREPFAAVGYPPLRRRSLSHPSRRRCPPGPSPLRSRSWSTGNQFSIEGTSVLWFPWVETVIQTIRTPSSMSDPKPPSIVFEPLPYSLTTSPPHDNDLYDYIPRNEAIRTILYCPGNITLEVEVKIFNPSVITLDQRIIHQLRRVPPPHAVTIYPETLPRDFTLYLTSRLHHQYHSALFDLALSFEKLALLDVGDFMRFPRARPTFLEVGKGFTRTYLGIAAALDMLFEEYQGHIVQRFQYVCTLSRFSEYRPRYGPPSTDVPPVRSIAHLVSALEGFRTNLEVVQALVVGVAAIENLPHVQKELELFRRFRPGSNGQDCIAQKIVELMEWLEAVAIEVRRRRRRSFSKEKISVEWMDRGDRRGTPVVAVGRGSFAEMRKAPVHQT